MGKPYCISETLKRTAELRHSACPCRSGVSDHQLVGPLFLRLLHDTRPGRTLCHWEQNCALSRACGGCVPSCVGPLRDFNPEGRRCPAYLCERIDTLSRSDRGDGGDVIALRSGDPGCIHYSEVLWRLSSCSVSCVQHHRIWSLLHRVPGRLFDKADGVYRL